MMMDSFSPATIWPFIQDYWIVPVGMLALYFYGQFHFNTPEYTLDLASHTEGVATPLVRIVTQAPPMFTTSRALYKRYARRYILILEFAFLVLIFCSGLVADVVRVAASKSADPQFDVLNGLKGESLQYKALWALFFLTGLLSSFPGFKDAHCWLLEQLHSAAFIPAEVRRLASVLYNGSYRATDQTLKVIRPTLTMRDTIRVAEGTARGSLEQRLIDLRTLRYRIQKSTETQRYVVFRAKLERAVRELATQTDGLRGEIINYLRDQEQLIPVSVTDIDAYIDQNLSMSGFAALSSRRQSLREKCDALFEAACLLSALSVLSTEKTPEAINQALNELGFAEQFKPLPILDWDAVARVTVSVFGLILMMNLAFAAFISFLQVDVPSFKFDRDSIARFALIFALLDSAVMIIGIKLKRRWHRDEIERPENIFIALVSYCGSLIVTIPVSIYFRHAVTVAPFCFSLAAAVLGYYVGRYVDRRLKGETVSLVEAAWQGLMQMSATLLAMWLFPPPGVSFTTRQSICFYLFVAVQTAVSGFLVGALFQFFYKQTTPIVPASSEQPSALVGGNGPILQWATRLR